MHGQQELNELVDGRALHMSCICVVVESGGAMLVKALHQLGILLFRVAPLSKGIRLLGIAGINSRKA